MKHCKRTWIALLLLALVALGCGKEKTTETSSAGNIVDIKKYKLAAEPKGSIGVIKARESTQDGDEVVVVGRVGGNKVPWAQGLAVFRIVDASLKTCADVGSDDCKTPWDY